MPDTKPSKGILQKLGLASNKPNPNQSIDDAVQKGLVKVRKEMPDMAGKKVGSSSGSLARFFMPSTAQAVTNPFTGNVTYNPEALKGSSQDEIENMLTHEFTHSRQTDNTPFYKILGELFQRDARVPEGTTGLKDPYHWRSRELEAFQAERDRTVKNKLPWMRDPQTGQGDVMLPSTRKKVAR